MTDWRYSRTQSDPVVLTVRYTKPDGTESSVDLTSTQIAESRTEFITTSYTLPGGDVEEVDLVGRITEDTFKTIAAVNGALQASRLSRGLSLVSGIAIARVATVYEYGLMSAGPPILLRERVSNLISQIELAASLPVPYDYFTPSGALISATLRERRHEVIVGRNGQEATRTETATWIAAGLTQNGQQSFAEQVKQLQGYLFEPQAQAKLTEMVNNASRLVFEGTETRISRGRPTLPSKPSDQEILSSEFNGNDEDLRIKPVRVVYSLMGRAVATRESSVAMPFAPDDFMLYQ